MREQEVTEILTHIEKGRNFLLSGGAGSGKTYSLVGVIEELTQRYPSAKIACMTYTNAAAKEILGRIDHQNLEIGTIHDFLWRIIKAFQIELKKVLIELHNDMDDNRIRHTGTDITAEDLKEEKIEYKEYVAVRRGVISHDELLVVAEALFQYYPKLSDVTKSMYPFILVDEYQDTSPDVVKILLDHFLMSQKSVVVGFFGDSMQSIYDDTVGNLNGYLADGNVYEVVKKQNRRNPQTVINIANAVRNDGLEQGPSEDQNAPNMLNGKVKDGTVRFLYSMNPDTKVGEVRDSLGWDLTDVKNVKELNLTHNLNAPRAGFKALMDIYANDKVLAYKKRITDYIKNNEIEDDFSDMTFGEVVDSLLAFTGNQKLVLPTPPMQKFIDEHPDLLASAQAQSFEVFRRLYVDKSQLIDDKKDNEDDDDATRSTRDALIKHLFSIQSVIHLYESGEVSEFLRKTDRKICRLSDKQDLRDAISKLRSMSESNIKEVLEFCDSSGLRRLDDDHMKAFKTNKPYLYDRVSKVKYGEFMKLFEYLEGRTPFSTQHKVKGGEFNKVFVALDNGKWNKYNFEQLFSGMGKESVQERSRKIFYVCCTRAREELVVYFNSPSPASIKTAEKWFGIENVVCIDEGGDYIPKVQTH